MKEYFEKEPVQQIVIDENYHDGELRINSYFEKTVFNNCHLKDKVTINGGWGSSNERNDSKKNIQIESGEFNDTFSISNLENCTIHLQEGTFKDLYISKINKTNDGNCTLTIDASKVKGTIKIIDCSFHQIDIKGIESSSTFISFEEIHISRLQISYYHAQNGLSFTNVSTDNTIDSLISFKKSNLGKSSLIRFHFDKFSRIDIIDTTFFNTKMLSCQNMESFQQKISPYCFNEEGKHKSNIDLYKKLIEDKDKIESIQVNRESYNTEVKKLKEYHESINPNYEKKEIFKEFRLAFKNSGDIENERLAYKYEMLSYMNYLKSENKKLQPLPHTRTLAKKNLIFRKLDHFFNTAILWVSYQYGHFGTNLGRVLASGLLLNSILFLFLLPSLYERGYYFSLCYTDLGCTVEAVNIFLLKLLNPLEKMDTNDHKMILDLLFKLNSGLFFYNIIRASRKYYQ